MLQSVRHTSLYNVPYIYLYIDNNRIIKVLDLCQQSGHRKREFYRASLGDVERNEVLPAGVTQIFIKTGRVMCVNIPLYKLENNYRDIDYIEKLKKNYVFIMNQFTYMKKGE
ncbi:TPA: hypothetical protein ACUI23_001469 [Staphylococcus pseudintermedius]